MHGISYHGTSCTTYECIFYPVLAPLNTSWEDDLEKPLKMGSARVGGVRGPSLLACPNVYALSASHARILVVPQSKDSQLNIQTIEVKPKKETIGTCFWRVKTSTQCSLLYQTQEQCYSPNGKLPTPYAQQESTPKCATSLHKNAQPAEAGTSHPSFSLSTSKTLSPQSSHRTPTYPCARSSQRSHAA